MSARYAIYTTLPAGPRRDALPQVMEGAHAQYRALAPVAPREDHPLRSFVFGERAEWEAFTSRKTGVDAAVYRAIPRGGYTIDDWFVVWSDHDQAVFSAVAHEGWHQYVGRHFQGRLPPFLEEGVACLFEYVRMEHALPRWNLSVNPQRTRALKLAAEAGDLWPLGKLITLHAGEVVHQPRARIEAFYAQGWAFARFLLEAEDGRYRPMLRRWLTDAAAGRTGRSWAPAGARAELEHYLQQDLAEIEQHYQTFVRRITARPARRE